MLAHRTTEPVIPEVMAAIEAGGPQMVAAVKARDEVEYRDLIVSAVRTLQRICRGLLRGQERLSAHQHCGCRRDNAADPDLHGQLPVCCAPLAQYPRRARMS